MVTRQDLTTAIERMTTRRVKIGDDTQSRVIPIHRVNDSRDGSVTAAGILLLREYDPTDTKFKFDIIEGEGWFAGSIADIEGVSDMLKEKGKGLIEKILKDQQQGQDVAARR